MKLKKLTFSNFRGFQQLDLELCDDLTVIAGVNGSGKSGVLKGIANLASYLAPNVSPAKISAIPFENSDIHSGKSAFTISATFSDDIIRTYAHVTRAVLDPKKIPKIRKELDELKTKRRFIEKGSKEDREAEDRIHQLNELLKDPEDNFSIQTERIKTGVEPSSDDAMFLFYPTNRAFKRLPPRLSGVKAMSRADAYAKALDKVEINLNDFAVWFRAVKQGKLGGKSLGKALLAMLEETVQEMLPGFSGLLLKEIPHPHFTIKKEKIRFSLEQLSDGERALLALAFDLVRRLTLANPESANPAKECKALVMIDEIELHLHPTWQRQVLRRLMAAFPNCQFIVTTHSPLVLGEVDAGCVRYLEFNEDSGKIEVFTPTESFGLDANRILDEQMGASERNAQIESKLAELFRLVDEDKFDEARNALKPLIERLGENEPEITRAQTLIKFLEEQE